MRERTKILKGDKVRFRPKKLRLYSQIYGADVDEDVLFTVAHVEPREGKRALYLAREGRESWIPAWPSALTLVERCSENPLGRTG